MSSAGGFLVCQSFRLHSQDDDAPSSTEQPADKRAGIGFHTAFLPYYLLFGLSLISQLPPVRELGSSLYFGLDYPSTETGLGFTVDGQDGYAKIKLLNHPAPLIVASLLIRLRCVPGARTLEGGGPLRSAAHKTYEQVISNSVGVATMVMMALVMTDTGMTALLGSAIARGTGTLFPIFSPYIGVLGAFMTGSNTNSNAMFGALQVETAAALGVGLVTIAATQSIGGSLGSSVAMSKVMAGTAVVGKHGWTRARSTHEDDPLLPGPGLGGRIASVGHHQSLGRQAVITKSKVQQIALWIMVADFPLLYLGAVTFENTALTVLALVIMAAAAVARGRRLLGIPMSPAKNLLVMQSGRPDASHQSQPVWSVRRGGQVGSFHRSTRRSWRDRGCPW